MQKLISILTVIVSVLPSAMGSNYLFWLVEEEYATNIKISESDPNQYNRVVPVVVFPGETVNLTLRCVNVNFDGDENAVADWNMRDLKYNVLNGDKVEISDKNARWSREIIIGEENKGVQVCGLY